MNEQKKGPGTPAIVKKKSKSTVFHCGKKAKENVEKVNAQGSAKKSQEVK
jgi:hypothetical protein